MNPSLAFALVLALCGCMQTISFGDDGPLAGLASIAITPEQTSITIGDLAAQPTVVEYTALGTFEDGTVRDVTPLLSWSVDNPAPGAFLAAGRYETSQRAGGRVEVRAFAGAIETRAALTVVVALTLVDNVFPPPLGAEAMFGAGHPIVTDPVRSPGLLYPAHGTRFPQGLARSLFQFATGKTNDAYRLRFESDVLRLSVLTGSDRWQPDPEIWSLIALSHPGADVQLHIDAAATTMPGTIYTSPQTPLGFSRAAPAGVIYYWSGATDGVMRAVPAASAATKLFPDPATTKCAGCHGISRDGSKMVVGYDGEKLQTINIAGAAPITNAATGSPMGWATFSPSGDRVLVADRGTLTLRDAVSGDPIGANGGRVPLAVKATQPDWSPDGRYVAFALSSEITNMEVKNASIARISYDDGVWGTPEILVAATADNNYFPRWSPDGKYLAYVRAIEPSRGAPSAELRLIRADGGTPVVLQRASHSVAAMSNVPDLANTMPSWAPAIGDYAWLSFASKRPYGVIRPLMGPSQIWITAIDLAAAERGGDPSSPAFWLPSQDIRVINNNPTWAPSPVSTQ